MKKLFIILFLYISVVVSATDYYVKNGGNDSNTGLSDATAWAHHPWMSTWTGSVVLRAGDNIYMNKGDNWISSVASNFMTVGQNGTSGNPITTSAYGTGAKPIIRITVNCSNAVIVGGSHSFISLDNLDIQHWASIYGSGTGISFGGTGTNVPHDWVITNCEIHNCPSRGIWNFTNSYNITIGDVTATQTASPTAHSNNIHHCGYAGVTLGGCDYVTKESNFSIYYNYIHDIIGTSMYSPNAYGVAMNCVSTSNGPIKNAWMRYNYVENIPNWEGLDTHGGSYIYFQHNYVKNCMGAIATQSTNGHTNGLSYVYIDHNILENPSTSYNYYFIQMQDDPGVRPNNCYIGYNKLFFTSTPTGGSGYGIKVVNHNNLIIEHNYFCGALPNTSDAIQDLSPTGINIIRYNTISRWYNYLYANGTVSYITEIGNIINNDECIEEEPPSIDTIFIFENNRQIILNDKLIIK